MNSAVGLMLEVIFAERGICGSCEQCIGPTQRSADANSNADADSNANALLSKPTHNIFKMSTLLCYLITLLIVMPPTSSWGDSYISL